MQISPPLRFVSNSLKTVFFNGAVASGHCQVTIIRILLDGNGSLNALARFKVNQIDYRKPAGVAARLRYFMPAQTIHSAFIGEKRT